MTQEEKKNLITTMSALNPYPVDIFPEPSDEDWKEIGNFLLSHGKNPDRIFAKWGRTVWNNCVNTINEIL